MTSKFESSPGDLALLREVQSASQPVCTIAAYRSEHDGEVTITVHVKMERTTPELESSDYSVALDAIADSIRNIQTGKLEPTPLC